MILVDANLLLYARISDFPQHETARQWLDGKLNGIPGVALPWQSLLAFVRLSSNPRIFQKPLNTSEAWQQVEEWLACPPTWTPEPTQKHGAVLSTLIPAVGNRPNLLPDANLAALALEYGLTLCSSDADFARFPGLRWENPLSP
jgi:toxin-antitoxin system PIN domain toxin